MFFIDPISTVYLNPTACHILDIFNIVLFCVQHL